MNSPRIFRLYVLLLLLLLLLLAWRNSPSWAKVPLTVEDSQSHSNTPHSVELLWTNDQPDAETST